MTLLQLQQGCSTESHFSFERRSLKYGKQIMSGQNKTLWMDPKQIQTGWAVKRPEETQAGVWSGLCPWLWSFLRPAVQVDSNMELILIHIRSCDMKCNQITVRLTTAGSHSLQDPSVTDMFAWVWLNTTHERVMYLKLILPCRETVWQLQILFWADNKSVNDWKSTKTILKSTKNRKVTSKWDKLGFAAQTNCSELW